MKIQMTERPRRLRRSPSIRNAIAETFLRPQNLVLPIFIKEGQKLIEPLTSMPGVSRVSLDEALKVGEKALELGIGGIAFFPVIDDKLKNPQATESHNPQGLVPRAVQLFKKHLPALTLYTDVALDPYSSEGHDGLVRDGEILNDESLPVLAAQALTSAQAGADFVAASDMMDGRIGHIRKHLDEHGFTQTGILAYTAKYASSFYGPFREALDSAPRFGDKKTYQMDYRNSDEALREARLDLSEGADIMMVKPALPYLDIIYRMGEGFDVPIAAYQVSGEYSSLKMNPMYSPQLLIETLSCIYRAGARIIFTYAAIEAAEFLRKTS